MIRINWDRFKVKNKDYTSAFESLCYHIFCRKLGLSEGAIADFNQVGLETEPCLFSDGKYYGFQSKFFEKMNYKNLDHSISKALENFTDKDPNKNKLNYIIIFLNCNIKVSSNSAKSITEKCKKKGVKVEWFLTNNFESILNQPDNLDLAQLFFGEADKLGFVSDSKAIRLKTLLLSREYIELSLSGERQKKSVADYSQMILENKKKINLLLGNPGSGKSVCMSKLFQLYTGADKEDKSDQIITLGKVEALAMYVNLNTVSLDSLENIIRSRQDDYSVREQSSRFIYLFDGLDEVSGSRIDATLAYIYELAEKISTKTIVISCRVSSPNKFKLKKSYKDLTEYRIVELSKYQIKQYFLNKGVREKQEQLQLLETSNPNYFENIQDILTLSILWKQIDKVSENSYIADLIEISVNETLSNLDHIKYLNELNIPNPKRRTIVELNKQISLYNFENQIVSIKHEQIYSILCELLPRCDYHSINRIIDFLAENYFDVYESDTAQSYTYRHRRYSEYFLMLSVIEKIKKDSMYIREKHLLINNDFFYKMLIPYLKNKAIKENDLSLSFTLGLYDVYLGKNRSWGVEGSAYKWSEYLTYALTSQKSNTFETIINDVNLPFKDYFMEVPYKIVEKLQRVDLKDKSHNTDLNYLFKIYFRSIVELYKHNKMDIVDDFIMKGKEILQLIQDRKYEIFFHDENIRDEFWKNKFYIDIVIKKEKTMNEWRKNILETITNLTAGDFMSDYRPIKLTVLTALTYTLTLNCPNQLALFLKDFNEYQMGSYLLVVCEPECLALINQNSVLKHEIINRINSLRPSEGLHQALIYAFKKYVGQPLNDSEITCLEKYISDLSRIESSVFWKNRHNLLAFLSLRDSGSVSTNIKLNDELNAYNKLYQMYVSVLKEECTLAKLIRWSCESGILKKPEVSYYARLLIGKLLAFSNEKITTVKGCINYLNRKKIDNLLVVYLQIKKLNNVKYKELINPVELLPLCSEENYRDIDYTSTSESMFIISYLLADIDASISYDFLLKGVEEGTMRLNARKDTLVDEKLINSFGILLKNNWIKREQTYVYVDKLINMIITLNKNNVSNNAFHTLLDVLIKNNFEIANYCYEKISKSEALYNEIHFNFAIAMVDLGIPFKKIEQCIANFIPLFDHYHQRTEWFYYYGKIKVYLAIGLSDLYSKLDQTKALEKLQNEIDSMEFTGWERKFHTDEYEDYSKLCTRFSQAIDAEKILEISHFRNNIESRKKECNVQKMVLEINNKEKLLLFFRDLQNKFTVGTIEQYEILVDKCVEFNGDIDALINYMKECRYPSIGHYNRNSKNLYLAVAAALRNANTKQQMTSYLINDGGGHDGYYELIKAYEVLGDKEMCLNLFNTFFNAVILLTY
ncbi:NACHT domain-containing protein [Priestia sp. D3YE.R1]|uniref:NACHT domain-containing protein n=1 Tax=Priestia sp. D3YE.R1 TaxID=3400416 RepID=UPI003BA19003